MSRAAAIAGMIGTPGLAFGFDLGLVELRNEAVRNSDPFPYQWLVPMLTLLVAASILLLAWFVGVKSEKSNLVSLTFLIVGLLLSLATTPVGAAFVTQLPEMFQSLDLYQTPLLLVHTSAFIMMIGALSLLRRRQA